MAPEFGIRDILMIDFQNKVILSQRETKKSLIFETLLS